MNKYVHEFYSLKCHRDILDIVMPIQNFEKEVSESMAMIKKLKTILLKNPNQKFAIYDFCSGNALTSVIISFLFKNIQCCAIDIAERNREWIKVKNFLYLNSDIHKDKWGEDIYKYRIVFPLTKTIILSIHPCKELAKKIISIYNESGSDYLLLMPCCIGTMKGYNIPDIIVKKIGSYLKWCMYLQTKIINGSKLYIDNNCLSPKNAVITSGF